MTSGAGWTQGLTDCREVAAAGGKAVNLGALLRAGFRVPEGFVITTAGWRDAGGSTPGPELSAQILAAYRAMGGGAVAVRSSATAEDAAGASMAGQYETILGVSGEDELLGAVAHCWASAKSERTAAYLATHGVEAAGVGMAVVVQRMVEAEVAGVLFTVDPAGVGRTAMLVEASWGLGETVVSGRVQPDLVRLDRATGQVLSQRIGDKRLSRESGAVEREVEAGRRLVACLGDGQLPLLWEAGWRIEASMGVPQDVEWAFAGGELYILQSRPITTLEAVDARGLAMERAREQLRAQAKRGRGPWVLHNLAETLAHPTTLTWSVIGRFMTGDGGFGAMYRMAGYEPSPEARLDGFLEVVAGRVYMDTARAPSMFFDNFPFEYDLQELRRSPDAGQAPPTVPVGGVMYRLRGAAKLERTAAKLKALSRTFDREMRETIIPEFVAWCEVERARDLSKLTGPQLGECFGDRERRVMDEFGPRSLLPSLIGGMALDDLGRLLAEQLWDEDAHDLASLLATAPEADLTARATADLYQLAQGKGDLAAWMKAYGFRGPGEFELSSPRWREQPGDVEAMARRMEDGADPEARHATRFAQAQRRLAEVLAQVDPHERERLNRRVLLARRYLPFREDGKHYLMMGYDLLRQAAVEIGARLGIGTDVFHLTREEMLGALRSGKTPLDRIDARKASREAEVGIRLPAVIEKDELERLGETQETEPARAGGLKGFGVSSGVGEGVAKVVSSPREAGELGKGYVLVCESTDPAWTPLLVNASAVVLGCGGTLSHGAVVARELGVPAVVLAEATLRICDGQRIRVDGTSGVVVVGDAPADQSPARRPDDSAALLESGRIPQQWIPPVAGWRERRSGRLTRTWTMIWGVFLLACWLLPETWLYRPSLRVMDLALWPIVAKLGYQWSVVAIGVGFALLTIVLQLWLTDNARLSEAKRRAKVLVDEERKLKAGTAVGGRMHTLSAGVHWRVFKASLVPLAVVLAPMVLLFYWLPARVDPASWSPRAGTSVDVLAVVDSGFREPVRLTIELPLEFDSATPHEQRLAPIRETLEEVIHSREGAAGATPEVAEEARALSIADEHDLRAYLAAGVPAQTVRWRLHTPPDAAGAFRISVEAGQENVEGTVVLGTRDAPREADAPGRGTIRELKVVYPKPTRKAVYWAPLQRWHVQWDAGWLSVYLLAYLPAFFVAKAIARVA